jgi:hypothetical protein
VCNQSVEALDARWGGSLDEGIDQGDEDLQGLSGDPCPQGRQPLRWIDRGCLGLRSCHIDVLLGALILSAPRYMLGMYTVDEEPAANLTDATA